MDIQVIQVDPKTRLVTFKIAPKKLTGVMKLVQIVILSLMNTQGRDVLDPHKGAGMPSLIGSNVDIEDSTELFADITQRVRKTETEIIHDQIGLGDPQEEKLREIQIIDITRGDNADEVFVKLRIINQAGQVADVMVLYGSTTYS